MMSFEDRVYHIVLKIPKGKVTTYKLVALAINSKAYRAVGQALRKNPYAPRVPCHRIVLSNGTIGGYDGQIDGDAIKRKKNLLKKEGIKIKGNRVLDFASVVHVFH